ncbi:MAG: slipin family protein [Pseudomonadota bacterium]
MMILNPIIGRTRVRINENERALYLWKGRLEGVLMPGEHWLASRNGALQIERHSLSRPRFTSDFEKALFDKLPDVAAKHFIVIRTGLTEVAVIERDGAVYEVIGPDSKRVFWRDAGPWTYEVFDVAQDPVVRPDVLRRLGTSRSMAQATVIAVSDGEAGLLFFEGAFERLLDPGVHAFWSPGRIIQHKLVDLKRQSLDVMGQEILTRDRVTLRVNIGAEYKVTDPVKAVTEVKDFKDALYRALQVAFRKMLGAKTLDQVLEQKVSLDTDVLEDVKAKMAAIGLEVSDINLKDVILPGDMREILNQVVAAEKEAEANVIRRREETNATRSLLNTAKVMADNPVMLRLKELEALESVANRVDTITVHSGTDGLLNDLVKLR